MTLKLARRAVMIRANDVRKNHAQIIETAVANEAIRHAIRRIKLEPVLTETANHDDGATYRVGNP